MSPIEPIQYFHRYTGEMETEAVYGGAFLKWAYGNPFGKLTVEMLVKRAFFSSFYGWWMSRPSSSKKVRPFVEKFGLDSDDFVQPVESFDSFNEFFSRALKPEARPVQQARDAIVFPADGRHLGFQDLSAVESVFVKGQSFDLDSFLGDSKLADRYRNGSAVLSRLCPTDYHRFHFSVDGVAETPQRINGMLYSVNPMALRQSLEYLWQNKRVLTRVKTETCGEVLVMEIGATNVGSIIQTFTPGKSVSRGEEKGMFRFGGSATMTFFEPGKVQLAKDLLQYSSQSTELYAHMGDVMASIR